ncbi:neuroblast differentiation-associated protein AHNAK isoform 2-T2 [Anableps anableps]
MSGESKSASISGNLALDDSGKGPSITGNVNTIAAKNGLKVEDDIVAATINLGNLDKSDVHNILENLKPYENNMKVLTKKDLNAGAALDSFGLGLKNAPEGLLKTALSLDSSADPPAVSLNGLSGGLNAEHGLGGKTTGPTLNGDLPKLSLNKPSGDAGATMTMPSMGLPGSDIKADLDGSLKGPDVSGSVPQIKIPNASLKIDKPHLRTGKYQAPKFSMPNFKLPQIEPPKTEMDISGDVDLPSVSGNVDTSDLNLSAPKFAFQSPDLDLNGPKEILMALI